MIGLFVLILISLKPKPKPIEVVDYSNKEWLSSGNEQIKKVEKEVVTYTGEQSYWFVVVKRKKDGDRMNGFLVINYPYFSATEALSSFGDPKDFFLLNFIEVPRETLLLEQ